MRKGDLPVFGRTSGYEDSVKHALAEQENSMFMADKLVADTEDKKNELEANIYELRGKIDDVYAEYASEEEKSKLKAKLEQSEVSILLQEPFGNIWISLTATGLALRGG